MLETIWSENWIWMANYLMSLGRIALSAAGIGFCIGILHRLSRENDGVKLTVWGLFLFLAEYVIISIFWFRVDRWGITTTLLTEAVMDGGVYGGLFFRDRKNNVSGRIQFSLKSYLPMMSLCLGAMLLAQNHNGYYGMQQDQGVYQTAAVAMISGNWENVMELDVYRDLADEDRERYIQMLPIQVNGFYFYEQDLEGLYSIEFASDATGYFHGIPTFPALLALWGGMFGIGSMGGIQTVLFGLLLALGYLLLGELGCGKSRALLGCGIVAVSPMVLWTAQSALTEVYLACALTAFLYFLTQQGSWGIWLSAVSIISFGCVHFSIYTIMPIVVLIYLGLYMRYRERTYIGAGILTTAHFWFVVNLTRMISTKYFYMNIKPLISMLPWLDRENVMCFITVVCVMVLALEAVLLLWDAKNGKQAAGKGKFGKVKDGSIRVEGAGGESEKNKKRKNTKVRNERIEGEKKKGNTGVREVNGRVGQASEKAREKSGKSSVRNRALEWTVRILTVLWCVLEVKWALEMGFQGGGEDQVTASVTGYWLLAGVVMLPAGLIGILAKPELLWKNRASALLGALFVYCIMIYSMAFRREIGYYYYYGRYLVPFIPLVVWQGMQGLQLLKGRINVAACGVVAAAQIVLLPYDLVLASQKDDTRMSWDALEQIRDRVGINDILVIEDSLLPTCYLPLTYLVSGEVLPQMQYPPEKIMRRYAHGEGQVYYLSSGDAEVGGTATVLRTSYVASGDQQRGERGLLGLPLRMESDLRYLQLDRLLREKQVYTAEDDCWINMFMNESNYRCGYGPEYGLSVCLEKDDYWVTVGMGGAIPLKIYGVEFYSVQVYVNGLYLQELRVYEESCEEGLMFEIPAVYLKEGKNEILFRSDPWRPLDFGVKDYREMGINISEIRFTAR